MKRATSKTFEEAQQLAARRFAASSPLDRELSLQGITLEQAQKLAVQKFGEEPLEDAVGEVLERTYCDRALAEYLDDDLLNGVPSPAGVSASAFVYRTVEMSARLAAALLEVQQIVRCFENRKTMRWIVDLARQEGRLPQVAEGGAP